MESGVGLLLKTCKIQAMIEKDFKKTLKFFESNPIFIHQKKAALIGAETPKRAFIIAINIGG